MKRMSLTALFLLLALPSAMVMAAPVGYSVNSDQSPGDTLHQIDLATGIAIPIGQEVSAGDGARGDIEGLAIAPDLSLWAIDEEKFSLFQINTDTGTVVPGTEVFILGIPAPRFNDFGMTFTCDDDLYASSVTLQTLYHIDTNGNASIVGEAGSLGVNISALASFGNNPVRIFGLGNGLVGETEPLDNRSLYEIDPNSGIATLIGQIGNKVSDYHQAGLSFDSIGQLWAITDRSAPALGSQSGEIILINIDTGNATVQANTNAIGFESLAIAPPGGCGTTGPGPKERTTPVPVLGNISMLLAVLALMFTGFVSLHRRIS